MLVSECLVQCLWGDLIQNTLVESSDVLESMLSARRVEFVGFSGGAHSLEGASKTKYESQRNSFER